MSSDAKPSHPSRARAARALCRARAAALPLLAVLLACASPAPAPAAPTWPTSESLLYALHLASSVALADGQSLARIELSAQLELTPLPADGERVRLGARLSEVRFAGPGHASAPLTLAAQELARPFTLTLVAGALADNEVDPKLSALALGVVRTLSAALQFAPAPDGAQVWSAVEYDATGRHRVEYRRAGASTFTRKKRAYTRVHQGVAQGARPAQLQVLVEHSDGRVTLREGRLATLTASERLGMPFGQSSQMKSQTQLTLRSVGSRAVQPDAAAARFAAATLRLAIDRVLGADEIDRGHFDEQRIGSETFDSAIAALERDAARRSELDPGAPEPAADRAPSEADEQRLSEHTRVFSALSAILRQSPEAIDRAVRLVRGESKVAREILSALGVAGNERAQAALNAVLLDEGLEHALRWQACFALSRTERASAAAVSALTAVLDHPQLGRQAAYGLGTIARQLARAGQTDQSYPIVAELARRLRTQQSVEGKAVMLRALGNAGDVTALPHARALLDDADQELRAAAADALRLIPLPEVDSLLAQQLTTERTSAGRVALLTAIAARAPQQPLLSAVERTALDAEDLPSRARAVRVLDTWAPSAPGVRSVLAHVAGKDASQDVRKLASTSLSRMD